ncbi:DUF192 domain-containing protein [Candidatus Nomurabacteria bacterium]|nr:DUF192 domain-containing protein [Candidatus Nomurabacteria bacterium]
MKIAERIVMVLILLCFVGGGAWIYFSVQYEQQQVRDAVARGEYERPIVEVVSETDPQDWRTIYPGTVGITIGGVHVEASIADTLSSRIKGLSDTPFLPEHVVKLFAFGVAGQHSIWMKDMKYPLDIMWVNQEGTIVHIEENVSPDTFPQSFASPTPAWYVVEANAGFAASNTIAVGDEVVLPTP